MIRKILLLSAILIGLISYFPVQAQDPDYHIEAILSSARFPVALAFAPDGRLFYTEKEEGRIRVVHPDGSLQVKPVIQVPIDSAVERGMIGIAVDPDFEENHFIWFYYTQPNTIEPPYAINKIVRFREENGVGVDPIDMLAVPVTTRITHHMGGNIHFGPDGMLYVSIGDYGDASFSQDREAMPGRIHRFQVDGDQLIPAPDNPFGAENSTYAYGLRNSFDFDFDPISGLIFASENGPECDDEINLIYPGGNYGWRPSYPCDDKSPQNTKFIYPLLYFTPTIAPTGVLIYDGTMFPEWEGDLFFCSWKDGRIRHAELNTSRDLIDHTEILEMPRNSCSTDLEVGPDGAIYFTNYNSIFKLVRD